VTSLVYQGGASVSLQADKPTLGLPWSVRRVSLCGALAALPSGGWPCQSAPGGVGASNPSFDQTTMTELLFPPPPPIPIVYPQAGSLPANLAPAAGGQAQVFPQPAGTTCSMCALVLPTNSSSSPPNPVLYGEIPGDVSNPMLVVESAGATSVIYAISASSGTPFSMPLGQLPSSVQAAWVSATEVPTGLSRQQQIFLTH